MTLSVFIISLYAINSSNSGSDSMLYKFFLPSAFISFNQSFINPSPQALIDLFIWQPFFLYTLELPTISLIISG
nr:MAG TPA: hypothetical protein [Bacteriophage sp.]